jgi:hypothetical protein
VTYHGYQHTYKGQVRTPQDTVHAEQHCPGFVILEGLHLRIKIALLSARCMHSNYAIDQVSYNLHKLYPFASETKPLLSSLNEYNMHRVPENCSRTTRIRFICFAASGSFAKPYDSFPTILCALTCTMNFFVPKPESLLDICVHLTIALHTCVL